MNPNFKSILILLATLVATAAINYSIMHSSFVFIVLLVLLAHELGHYFSALLHKANPSVPYIIPLPYIAIGITYIKDFHMLLSKDRRDILLAGPLTGVICSLFLALYFMLNPIYSAFYLVLLAALEFILNFIGSDGIRYRDTLKEDLLYV